MANPSDKWNWAVIAPANKTTITPSTPSSGFEYELLNWYTLKMLRYGTREYGINLVWKDASPQTSTIAIFRQSGAGPLRGGELCAIQLKDGGFLKYQEREYGINLVWSSTPVYEWRIDRSDGAATAVDVGQPVGIFNTTRDDYLFADPRRYGIDLKWLEDKGKHNSRPWYETVTNFVTGVASDLWALAKELSGRVLNSFDMVLTFLGIMIPKRIRIKIMILRDEFGIPVMLGDHEDDAVRKDQQDHIDASVDWLRSVLKEQVNVSVHVSGDPLVVTLDDPAPTGALDPTCSFAGTLSETLSLPGRFYRSKVATNLGSTIGYGDPVTIFIVRSVKDKIGCSGGPLTSYVVVSKAGIMMAAKGTSTKDSPTTLAHEVGHSTGLWHPKNWPDSGKGDLMWPDLDGRGRLLELHQRAIFRGSRHVTFF